MSLKEFKAWLNGFCDGLGGRAPNADEWVKIKENIDKLQTEYVPVTTTPFVWPYESPFMPTLPANPRSPKPMPMVWCQTDGYQTNECGASGKTNGVIVGGNTHGVN